MHQGTPSLGHRTKEEIIVTKTHRIEFRVSEADLQILTAGATKAGVALSEFIREAAADRARRLIPPKEARKVKKTLERILAELDVAQGEVQS